MKRALLAHRPHRFLWRPLFAAACLGLWLVSAGASRGYFVLTLDEMAETWPAGTVPTTLAVPALTQLNVAQTPLFARQKIDAKDVRELQVEQVGLVMVQPASLPSFDFLRRCHVVATADGLPERTIASGGPFADGTNFVGLEVADVDLQAYARRPNFAIRGVVDDADAPASDVSLRLVVNLQTYVGQPGAACWQ